MRGIELCYKFNSQVKKLKNISKESEGVMRCCALENFIAMNQKNREIFINVILRCSKLTAVQDQLAFLARVQEVYQARQAIGVENLLMSQFQ